MRTFTAVFRIVGLAFAALAVLTIAAAGQIVALLFPEVDDQAALTSLTRIALASQVFFGLGTLLMAAQYARRRFTHPALAPLIYNLGIIAGGLVGWLLGDPSPASFLLGGLAGAAIGNFGLQAIGARRLGYRLVPGTPWLHPAVRRYFVLALPLMLGISAVALDEQWPRFFGQFADNDGASLALTSARQLNMMPVGLIAQAAGVAAYPFLAGLAAEGRIADLGSAVLRSVRASVAVGGLAAGLVAGLALPIVVVVYGHGKSADSSDFIANLLLLYAVAIPFWPAHQVYSRAFYAMERMWTPVAIGSGVTVLVIPVLWFLVNRHGAAGVAVGSTFGVILYTLAIGAAWHALVARPGAAAVVGFGVRVIATAVATGAVALAVSVGLGGLGAPSLLRLVAGAALGAPAYLLVARVLGVDEVRLALDRVLARFKAAGNRSEPDPPTSAEVRA